MASTAFSPMDFDNVGIGTALKRSRLAVPLNQREYRWEERNVLDLFHDLANAINSGKQGYFLGTIVLTKGSAGTLEVADGQQRLATTTILLAALRDYYFEQNDEMMVQDLENFLFTIVREAREINPRLQLNVSDNEYFRNRVLEKPNHSGRQNVIARDASHHLIDQAARLAKSHVENIISPFSEFTRNDILTTWINFIESAAQIIVVTVPDDMSAFVIFETLNDRGLKVSQADLVKNYLFSETETRKTESQQKWASMNGTLESLDDDEVTITYLRHLLISQHGHIREKDVLEKVKGTVLGRAPAMEFLDLLSHAARDYVALWNPAHSKWIGYKPSIREHIRTLGFLRITPLRPLMLAVARAFPIIETEKAFRQFVVWSVRLLIAGGARSGRVEEALALAAKNVSDLELTTAHSLFKQLETVLPSDAAFEQAFSNAEVSNHGLARYYLRALERKMQDDPEPEWVPNDESVITLEHILPENPGANWPKFEPAIHSAYYKRIGNMVLLSQTPNHDLGNDSFDDKKVAYEESTYQLTHEVIALTHWAPSQIELRQQRLAKLAIETWPLPN